MSILGLRRIRRRPVPLGRRLLATSMLAVGLAAAAVTVSAPAPAAAQSAQERLDRLERDLQLLQRQVYRGDFAAGQTPPPSTAGAGVSGDVATRLQDRITELEQLVTRLTGRVEETQYQVQQTDQRLQRFMDDVDFRLQQLEGTGGSAAAPAGDQNQNQGTSAEAPAPGQGTSATQGGFRPATPSEAAPTGGQGAGSQGLAPGEGTLGTIPAEPPAEGQAEAPAAQGGPVLPEGTPEEQYSYAFGLLREGAYDRAARSFEAFVERHPEHALAGNAQYWLGETHYVQGDYERAAVTFLDGYRSYPESPKAPDNLLKLGLTMAQLDKTREACAAFTRISGEYPQAPDPIQRRARSEAERLGCGNL
ncbi:tol-pal system protein YbgF [Caenispirillum salinarum]|uniref:tol-pal system protein YbgF n=1 Tax=Caenispirillum salinarum TaxID=859058 RepID=UPI00384AE433